MYEYIYRLSTIIRPSFDSVCWINLPLGRRFLPDECNIGRQFSSFPVKIQGDSYTFDIAESEYNNQIAPSPTIVMDEKIKFKNYACNKK